VKKIATAKGIGGMGQKKIIKFSPQEAFTKRISPFIVGYVTIGLTA